MASLQGRHALVTGGGRGIGRATAAALSRAGATVTVIGRSEDVLKDAVAKGDARNFALADVTDGKAMAGAVGKAVSASGPIDLLVSNAGSAKGAVFAKADPDVFREMFDVHAMGMVHATQAVLGGMVSRGFGRVVAIASIAGLKGFENMSAYCAAKHAMVGLVRSLALETAKSGVTVNAVCPGYVDTDMIRGAMDRMVQKGSTRDQALAQFADEMPAGRLVRPDEVAEAVVYLCSPAAAAVTGTTLVIGAEGP